MWCVNRDRCTLRYINYLCSTIKSGDRKLSTIKETNVREKQERGRRFIDYKQDVLSRKLRREGLSEDKDKKGRMAVYITPDSWRVVNDGPEWWVSNTSHTTVV